MSSKLSKEKFIENCEKLYGKIFDYSMVDYKGCNFKVKIKCIKHDYVFEQKPYAHYREGKHGCVICKQEYKEKFYLDLFLKESLNHHSKYDYSRVKIGRLNQKVKIICPEHGEFEQHAYNHMKGMGCLKCSAIKRNSKRIIKSEDYLNKLKLIHGDRFDYSRVNYTLSKNNIELICKNHGSFFVKPIIALKIKGCPKCYLPSSGCGENGRYTTEQFINISNLKHLNKYDYSKTVYISYREKITIICPIHGEFIQKACDHLSGCGCRWCGSSSGELEIRKYLINNNIKFEEQKTFENLKNNIHYYRFDFYLSDYNLCIEFDGCQHFFPVKYSKRITKEESINEFENIQRRDLIKNKYCLDNNINLLRINYKQKKNIKEIIDNYLNHLKTRILKCQPLM